MDVSLGLLFNNLGVVGICVFLMLLFVSDKIISGRRYREERGRCDEEIRGVRKERDRWQNIALETLKASATAIVPAAEAVNHIVNTISVPAPDATTESDKP